MQSSGSLEQAGLGMFIHGSMVLKLLIKADNGL